jgi:hypothetical protein
MGKDKTGNAFFVLSDFLFNQTNLLMWWLWGQKGPLKSSTNKLLHWPATFVLTTYTGIAR